jgi:hypothetical protein
MMASALPLSATMRSTPQVTGQVTAITADVTITVDGRQYAIAAGSPAATTIRTLHIGDRVSLYMDGPASKTGSHVVSIDPQSSP